MDPSVCVSRGMRCMCVFSRARALVLRLCASAREKMERREPREKRGSDDEGRRVRERAREKEGERGEERMTADMRERETERGPKSGAIALSDVAISEYANHYLASAARTYLVPRITRY